MHLDAWSSLCMLQVEADDSDKEETEPSDVEMSGCDSEDKMPRKSARSKKGGKKESSPAKKQALEVGLLSDANTTCSVDGFL